MRDGFDPFEESVFSLCRRRFFVLQVDDCMGLSRMFGSRVTLGNNDTTSIALLIAGELLVIFVPSD